MGKIGTTDAHAIAVGNLYRVAGDYIEKYKVGGKQKLQKIIGEDLFYKKGKDWYWNNPKIIRMTTIELKNLVKKIENN